MELGLGGKLAVVTGASKGIGLAVTRRFVEEGARVVAGSRSVTAELAELVDGGAVEAVTVDLAEPDGPARLDSRRQRPARHLGQQRRCRHTPT